jgi:plastocyanin
MKSPVTALRVLTMTAVLLPAMAFAEAKEFTLVMKDHQFVPAELTVPAGEKFTLIVDNQDANAEEFESHDLDIEKVIPAKTSAKILVLPQDAGRYNFVGEFHEDNMKGVLIVK